MKKDATSISTPQPTRNWRRDLKTKPNTNLYLPTIANAKLIFANDNVWRGKLAWDELNNRVIFLQPVSLGANNMPDPNATLDHFWNDSWTFLAATWLERSPFAISLPQGLVRDAIESTAKEKWVHPVRQWLRGLEWDKVPRLDGWFTKNCGVKDSPYHNIAFSKWLISAVARVMQPGCQADHMLVLEGPKGAGKTSFFRILGGEWYAAITTDLGGKDAVQNLWGVLIGELPELSAVKRAQDVERVKAFITTSVDKIRKAYGAESANYPRQCVLGGSTNAAEWLREDSERRFWPYHTDKINLEALIRDRGQLWAEAHTRYLAGEKWYIDDPDILNELSAEVEARREVDPWETILDDFLRKSVREHVTSKELGGYLSNFGASYTRADEMRIGTVLRILGWEHKKKKIQGVSRWVYTPNSYYKNNKVPTYPTFPTTSGKLLYGDVLPLRKRGLEPGTDGTEASEETTDIGNSGGFDGK